jgi:hypothetical protein
MKLSAPPKEPVPPTANPTTIGVTIPARRPPPVPVRAAVAEHAGL